VRGKFDANGICDPGGSDVTCASLDMTFPHAARGLLVAPAPGTSRARSTARCSATCFLYADDMLASFRVDCRENAADITFVTGLSAVRLSAG
jgi:hypothetical protein